jgi:hypothetical protein
MSILPQRYPVITAGETVPQPSTGLDSQQIPVITAGETVPPPSTGLVPQRIPVITAGETVPLPSTGLVSQQIPVITAGLTVPQPSTGLDWQCDAGNMQSSSGNPTAGKVDMTADDTLDDVTAGGLLVITFFLAEAP